MIIMLDASSIYALRLYFNIAASRYIFVERDVEDIKWGYFEARQIDSWIKNNDAVLGISVCDDPMPVPLCVDVGLDD